MMPSRPERDPSDYLPLSSTQFHILLALAGGEKHGYAILKEVARTTEGRVRLSASTLYGVIQRLESEGLIKESDVRPDPALDDERRRYYRLTDFGRRVGMAETDRLEHLIKVARANPFLFKPRSI